MAKHWEPISTCPAHVIVMTKIDDADGVRNEQLLKRGDPGGHLWFVPDGSMYVYYEPTHWKDADPAHRLPVTLTVSQETLNLMARLKVEYGVTTNTEVLREALRRTRVPSHPASGEGK